MRTAEQLRYLVLAAQREGNRALNHGLAPLGLTTAQAEVVRILGDHGPMRMSDIGSMLVCDSGSSPSRLVDRLVRSGIASRTEAKDDRRNVVVALTDAGRATDLAVRRIEDELYAAIDIALDEASIRTIVDGLGRLIQHQPAGSAVAHRMR